MLSNIGRAAIKRIGGSHLPPNRILISTVQLQRVEAQQNVQIVSVNSSLYFLARRLYATATKATQTTSTKAKSSAAKKPAAKKPVAKKATATKSKTTKAAKKPVKKAKGKPGVKSKSKLKKTKKVVKPKKKALKKKPKPVPENIKLFRQKKDLRIAGLLPEQPHPKPTTAYTLYVQEVGGQVATDTANKFKSLSTAEKERLNHQTNQNKAEYDAAVKKWVSTLTPDQIRVANNARTLLRRKTGKQVPRPIPDNRIPTRPRNELNFFARDRHASGDYKNIKPTDALRQIASEYKSLPPADRQPYVQMKAADRARYTQEFQTVFGREPFVRAKAKA